MAISRPAQPWPEISWSGWGDPAQAESLPDGLHRLLREGLGIRRDTPVPRSIDELQLEPVRLADPVAAELASIVGAPQARSDHEARVRHALGKSTIELLQLRREGRLPAPDLVLSPGSHDEVLAVLMVCSAHRVAVVPFGGGTTVVGGVVPEASAFAGVVALDLRRLDALLELDEVSRLAVFEPGLRGPQAEALLARSGFTIGHFPQSFQYATLGGFAAARSSGQASAGYGRFVELVLALRAATPAGTLTLGRAPRSAAGPDLRQLMLGSEGALGVITSLTVAIRPSPERRIYDAWRLPSFRQGAAVLRALAQDGPTPTVVRLSDEAETAFGLARPGSVGTGSASTSSASASSASASSAGTGGQPPGCLAIVGWEGTGVEVARRRDQAEGLLTAAGGEPVTGAGDEWAADRYRAPYLRDALLAAGVLVETLETVAFWSALHGLYEAVSAALRDALTAQGTPPAILCHISHVYASGASLYFTVACAQLEEPIAQWRAAKAAVADAILAAGGSISHHHGVGTDHRQPYEREVGPQAIAALRAVKRTLDPAGILNPGILLPPPGAGSERHPTHESR